MKHTRYFLMVVSLIVCMSCGGSGVGKDASDCSIPPPEAIFKADVGGISNHTFELSGRNSEESMEFADSTAVTIFQSGCDKISQEYRFTLPPSSDQMSRSALAVDRLNFLAKLGPDYMTFGGWANAIVGLQAEFAVENTVQVEPGFYVSLDKLDSSTRTTLIIKLFQK